MLTYNVKLEGDKAEAHALLEAERLCWNYISAIVYELYSKDKKVPNIKLLHDKCYKKTRRKFKNVPAQVVIRAELDVKSTFASIKSNKHKITKAPVKEALSIRLDRHLYRIKGDSILLTSVTKKGYRNTYKIEFYPQVRKLSESYRLCDPLLFEKDGIVWLAMSFDLPDLSSQVTKNAIGVDLGIKRAAAISDGRIIKTEKHNAGKRRTRYLKRCLYAKATKSARQKLKSIRRKERNQNKNNIHLVANEILKTKADTIVLEDLKGLKSKSKGKKLNNKISQVSFYELRRILTYKAPHLGKRVVTVNPRNTSRDDFRGLPQGKRMGCRYTCSDGVVLDADLNAANNIVLRTKLPSSCVILCNALSGQADVNRPIVYQSKDGLGLTIPSSLDLGN